MSAISLESKVKLPQKILEIITDASALLSIPMSSSQSAEMLIANAKQLNALSPVLDRSAEILKNIDDLMSDIETTLPSLDKGLDVACDIQECLQKMERQSYYCSVPKSMSTESFSSSVASERPN